MSAISERIAALVRQSGLSMRELARRMNVSNVSLSQWASGKNKPSDEGLQALCEYFEVTPAFILYGDGNAPQGQSIALDADTYSIPLLRVDASCGGGRVLDGSAAALIRFVRVSGSFLRRFCPTANKGSLQIITVTGDSMEPTLHDGDAVIIDLSDTALTRDGLYCVRLCEWLYVKRVQMMPSGVTLISDNRLYDPIHVDEPDTLVVVGRCYAGLCLKRL